MIHRTPYAQTIAVACIALCSWSTAFAAPATFPMVDGELAVTGFSGFVVPNYPGSGVNPNGFVLTVIDARIPPCCANPVPVLDTNWLAPLFHNEFPITVNTWNESQLGQVFGLAFDDQSPPNIYVSATTTYGNFPFTADGPGAVFKINGSTGAISSFIVTGTGLTGTNTLDNSGPALGNICHDPAHNQFFVTNFENGEITRHDAGGVILSRLDPFNLDNGATAFAPRGERLWAVQVFQGRLYFSVWLRDSGNPGTPWNPAAGPSPANPNNSIWSIALDAGTGNFVGAPLLEIVVPYLGGAYFFSNPVSDIAFSSTGAMILGERTRYQDYGVLGSDSHQSRVLHYTGGSGAWAPSGQDYFIGRDIAAINGQHYNSAGGVDFDCDVNGEPNVWSTGDALHFGGGEYIYGLQRVPFGGNTNLTPTSTSYLIDLDGVTTGTEKTHIGDVEVYVTKPCGNPLDVCPVSPTDIYCKAMQDHDCQALPPVQGTCLPKVVLVASGSQGVFTVTECDCIEGCGEVEIVAGGINCPNVCPNPPPGEFCQIHFDGVAQGSTGVAFDQVPDGTEVTCDCATDPQVCPLPQPPLVQWCANRQNLDCVNSPIGECLPKAVRVDFNQPGIFEVVECDCLDGCGVVDIQGDLLRCPFRCPNDPDQLCQIHFDGVPQGLPVIINTAVPNGTIVTCACDDDPPTICQSTDGLVCDPFMCPIAGEECKPRCVRDDGTGVYLVEECECMGVNDCFIIHDVGIPPFCEDNCPPGEVCVQTISIDPLTGHQIICCDCEPEQVCGPAPGNQTCLPVTCPIPGEECISKCLLRDVNGSFSVLYCECDNPDDCHIELVAGATNPICVGDCPPGETCELTVFTNADGSAEYCCECVPDPPNCGPTDDEMDCKPFICPDPNEECQPRCIREVPGTPFFTVIDCDCRPIDDCHVEFDPAAGAFCEGNCPPGFTCLENRVINSDGTVDVCCDCVRKPCKCPGDLNGDNFINGLDIQPFIRCLLGNPFPDDNCTCADMDGDGLTTLADLQLFVAAMFTREPCVPPACPPSDLSIDFATGVNDNGSLIALGSDDDDWVVTCEPQPGVLPRPAQVIPANPAWNTIPGTGWISANQFGPNGDYCYDFCFCLDERFSNPQLLLQLRADDHASVFLNGTLLGSTPNPSFNTATPTVITTNNPNLFVVGENCVQVVVTNSLGVVTGLNLAGTFTADDGQCCCDEADLDESLDSGVDDDGNLIPVGGDDEDWIVTVDAAGGTTPRPAKVINPNGAWLTIPGTQWISANSTGPNGLYVYEHCFCLDPRFENAQLTLDLRADDFAVVCLNGVQIGATPPSYAFNTPQPTHIFVTNQDLFICGKNCIEVKVTNSHGVVTGVNIAGQIMADKGLCCCAPNPMNPWECCPQECADPDQTCVPRCVHISPSGEVTVTDCECRDENECRVAPIIPMTLPICINGCPNGTVCQEQFVHNPDGSIDLCCDCEETPPFGACCLPNGNCGITNMIVCEAHNGIYLGDNTPCLGVEACCLQNGSCIMVDAACCGPLHGGVSQGAGSVCLGDANMNGIDDACEDLQQEFSCCEDATGLCVDLAPGVFQCPPGQTLVVGPCGFPEACCLPSGICLDAYVPCCLNLGGTPQGAGTNCATTQCSDVCDENATHTACLQVECPNPDEHCIPSCVTIDLPTGQLIDLVCECRSQDQCFLEVLPPPVVGGECVNVCPPGQICVRTETFLQGGAVVEICCDCVDAPPSGSCCDASGICIPEPVGGCPPGTTFHPGPCQPLQGCCLPNGQCTDLDPRCCMDLGGVVTANLCSGTVTGCCFQNGTCVDLDLECCIAQGGMPGPAPCQPPEACCFLPPYAPLCINTDPACCQQSGGVPQGAGTVCLGDNDGDGVDDICQDPPPGICPLPNSSQSIHCEAFQGFDCMETPGVTGEECLPFDFLVPNPGGDPLARCKCQFPDACGPVNFVGTVYSCPGVCPPGTEPCQIYIEGVPTGLGSIDASSPLLSPGDNITCGCQ